MKKSKGKIYIGTSGWSYDWNNFYPKGISSRELLRYYSRYFDTTEVNYSFYRLPKINTYEKWAKETGDNFIFALKLSRYITHIKRLSGIKTGLKIFLLRAKSLGNKLGPILIQMPPSFKIDLKRLEYFLKTAKKVKKELKMKNLRLAFEFRHKSWFEKSKDREKVLGILKKHNSVFVFAHSGEYPYPQDEPLTADFIYLRFHGPKELFASEYGKKGLKPWAEKIKKWLRKGLNVYVYFNNDVQGYAIKDAKILLEFCE